MADVVGMIPLSWFLLLGAALVSIGLFGVMTRRNAVSVLMAVELILNGANVNLVGFWRYVGPEGLDGLMFVLMVMTIAACEAAVGLALIINVFRSRRTVDLTDVDLMQG
jgi:NADH:ubiquinone oxidoreductase subunit K